MSLSNQQIAEVLAGLVGPDSVIADPAGMARFLNEPRKRFHQGAAAVAVPGSVPALQALMRWANENRVPIVPQGGNTGLVGGQVPLRGDEVIVSITRI